jgi:hypothetical protein
VGAPGRGSIEPVTRHDAAILRQARAAGANTGAHVGAAGGRPVNAVCDPIAPVSKLDAAILRTQARAALTGLGWKPAIAHAAVDAAVAARNPGLTLERLVFESLRRCPAPGA